jgi:hypothetical protein
MRKTSTLFLKVVLVFMAIGGLGLCVIAMLMGIKNQEAASFRTPLFCAWLILPPYLFALVQAWKLLVYIDKDTAFSKDSIKALRYIKYCGIVIAALVSLSFPYFYKVSRQIDPPGFMTIWLVLTAAPIVVAVFAAVLQKLIQSGMEIKEENELTV